MLQDLITLSKYDIFLFFIFVGFVALKVMW